MFVTMKCLRMVSFFCFIVNCVSLVILLLSSDFLSSVQYAPNKNLRLKMEVFTFYCNLMYIVLGMTAGNDIGVIKVISKIEEIICYFPHKDCP